MPRLPDLSAALERLSSESADAGHAASRQRETVTGQRTDPPGSGGAAALPTEGDTPEDADATEGGDAEHGEAVDGYTEDGLAENGLAENGLAENSQAGDSITQNGHAQNGQAAGAPSGDTPAQQLAAVIHLAQNRHDRAATPGANVRTGRFSAESKATFERAISAARRVHDSAGSGLTEAQAEAAMRELRTATDAFHNAVIDPDARYRPFLPMIAEGEDHPQKRHLRAVWIATVINIDWPSASARGTTPAHVDRQKAELKTRFDEVADLGFNAVIFQISPTGDAMYDSAISPWSAWLTGETNFTGRLLDSSGVAFDPLHYAIQLARERHIELHAWFNPYRITHVLNSYTGGAGIILSSTGQKVDSLAQIRDEWTQIPGTAFHLFGDYVKLGENRYVVDPAAPGVRDWIVDRVLEVVRNYDIDAVHFDDYFYPGDYVDTETFARYNTTARNRVTGAAYPDTTQGRNDWRRENTEMMIRDVSQAIRHAAPWVKFGISPGGVWKSAAAGNTGLAGGGYNSGTGSPSTTTWSNYHSSYADTRRWVIENYIDYLTPQVYWDWTLPAAPYGAVADWWSRLFFDYGPKGHLRNSRGEYTNAQLYIGTGLYRMLGNPIAKWNYTSGYEREGQRTFLRQEAYNIGNPNISGSMVYSQNQTRPGRENHMRETMVALRETMWRYPALPPAMPHLGGTAPAAPRNVTVDGGVIRWDDAETSASPLTKTRYFVIYRFTGNSADIGAPANILAIVPARDGQTSYTWQLTPGALSVRGFAVTAVNRLHDESRPTPAR